MVLLSFLLLLLYLYYPDLATASRNLPFSLGSSGNGNLTLDRPLMKLPIHREVNLGGAWLYPTQSFDIQARDDTCECFDPTRMKMCSMLAESSLS